MPTGLTVPPSCHAPSPRASDGSATLPAPAICLDQKTPAASLDFCLTRTSGFPANLTPYSQYIQDLGPLLPAAFMVGTSVTSSEVPAEAPRCFLASPCESSAPRQFIGPRTAQPLTCCLGFTPHSLLAPLPPWPRPAGHIPLSSCRLPGHFASDLAWAPQPYIPGWALAVYSARKVLPQRPAHPPNCFSLRSTGSPDHSS